MQKHPAVTRQRVRHMLDRHIGPAVLGERELLDIGAYHVHGEPIPAAEAFAKEYTPFVVGAEWGPAWGTTWFRVRGRVPDAWKGERVVLSFRNQRIGGRGLGAEALVWDSKQPMQGLSGPHTEYAITDASRGGEAVELYLECAANPQTQSGPAPPLLLPDPDGPPLFRLLTAELAVFRRNVWTFSHDFRVLLEMMEHLPETDPRAGEILYGLNQACNLLDPEDVAGTVPLAEPVVRRMLARPAGDSAHRVSAVGHAHLDTAWLWPIRESVRKAARTFSTAVKLMDEYPEYHFVCSQAQQYAWIRDTYPELFERIRDKVKAGQFEPVGSLWVEMDCNIPSGESLVRQITHGKRFFLDELGYETTDVWLPDVFGYSAALPQIMAQAGISYFLTQKISWNQLNRFPHHTFWWEGIDGTRVFTHFPPADTYNADFSMRTLFNNVRNFREHGRSGRSLYVYGHGDGGGGPTRDMLETARRVKDLDGAPRVDLEPAVDFFDKAREDARDLAVWVGELYLEYHRGTYTTQARTKRNNRAGELLLREAELWSVARPDAPSAYPATELDAAWKLLLLNQFHDIIPGSSIHWVYDDASRDYAEVDRVAAGVVEDAVASLVADVDTSSASRPAVVLNPAPFAREGVIVIPGEAAADGAGTQMLPDGSAAVWARVPALGHTVIDLASNEAPEVAVEVGERFMDNGLLRVEWDADGMISSIHDRHALREVLAAGQRGNVLQLHRDYPNSWDAWDVDPFYAEQVEDITALDAIEVVEAGPLRAAVRTVRTFGRSTVTQTMRLCAGSRLIEFDTEVDWNETHRFLKVAFPVDVRSARATYEIQFGHIERPTHANTSWDVARFEVCAHKWADLSEPGYGVALVNDCKYGHDIHGNVMRLSLLRAPTWPDPKADRGLHRFRYGLLPHTGDLRQGGVIDEAYAFNMPVRTVATDPHPGSRPATASVVWTDHPRAVIESVKRADADDAVIVRLYEAWGARGPVRVTTSLSARSASRCDLLERDTDDVTLNDGTVELQLRPFEIVTLKYRT